MIFTNVSPTRVPSRPSRDSGRGVTVRPGSASPVTRNRPRPATPFWVRRGRRSATVDQTPQETSLILRRMRGTVVCHEVPFASLLRMVGQFDPSVVFIGIHWENCQAGMIGNSSSQIAMADWAALVALGSGQCTLPLGPKPDTPS